MDFKIQSSRPIWQQLTEQLRQRIVTGVYPPGSRFPAVRELASEAGVNPNTMQRAMSQLETDELVITNRTLGAHGHRQDGGAGGDAQADGPGEDRGVFRRHDGFGL